MKQDKQTQLIKKRMLWLLLVVIGICVVMLVVYTRKSIEPKVQPNKQASRIPCQAEVTNSIKDPTNSIAGAPTQMNLAANQLGTKLTISGSVTDTHCKLVVHAKVFIWQTDSQGSKPDALSGMQYTDAAGRYTFMTVMPSAYSNHAPHINISVQATDQSPILTTQLFFPDDASNKIDRYYDDGLLFSVHDVVQGKAAMYNLVVER